VRCGPLVVTVDCLSLGGLEDGAAVTWGVRPDHVIIHPGGQYEGAVTDTAHLGSVAAVTLGFEGGELYARTPQPVGDRARFDLDHVRVWPL
jgi:hypothetical protein